VTCEVLGARGQVLEFETTARKFAEEITSKTGIPPFMLGLSWSTTERMSTSQAKLLTEVIDAGRHLLTPALEQLITLHLKLTNRRGKFTLKWPEVSLMDLVDTARAAWMQQQADAIKIENMQELGRLGIFSVPEIAQQFRPDLEDLTPDEVKERLNGENGAPKLVEELPEPVAPPVPGGGAGPPKAGRPPRGAEPPGGNNPRAESQSDEAALRKGLVGAGNGNGRH
jgi:hypothetical protein